jgi:hypothetical protein
MHGDAISSLALSLVMAPRAPVIRAEGPVRCLRSEASDIVLSASPASATRHYFCCIATFSLSKMLCPVPCRCQTAVFVLRSVASSHGRSYLNVRPLFTVAAQVRHGFLVSGNRAHAHPQPR